MSFSNRILVGLASGVAVGLFFGESASVLEWAANGFVKLLQVTVLPYVLVSIVGSLGRLRYADARALGIKTGAVLLGIWAVALVFTFLIPLAFPHVQSAAFFSTSLIEQRAPFNFVDLYIPSNPFYSLANNIVPAVVLFSALLGVALIGVERKDVVLDVLSVMAEALLRATRFVTRLTPYGLFAIAANAAGTLSIEQLGRLQVYLVVYVLVSLLFSLWVLPGLIAAVTPIRVRDLLSVTRDVLLTAFVAADLFIVLPVLIEASNTLLQRATPADARATKLPDVIVPTAFNLPHSGKLLSISFILFAGWFADAVVGVSDYPRLALTGLVTFFGSLTVAVPFLLDLFKIPTDTFQLFLASGVVNSHFGTLVAAMHTLAVALIGSCAITGHFRWRPRELARYALVTAAATTIVIGGTRLLFTSVLDQRYTKDQVLANMHLLTTRTTAVVQRERSAAPPPVQGAGEIETIRSRGVLRVGYLTESLPFAFFNERGALVGLDVELAHHLAAELGVRLELVPTTREQIDADLAEGYCDLVMSGVPVTTLLASRMTMSNAYLDETLGFVVPDAARERFATWDSIKAMGPITLAVPNVPYYIDKLHLLLPEATLRPLTNLGATLSALPPDVAGIVLPAERGSAWTLMYPAFSAVVPVPGIVKVPLAYPIAKHDQAFVEFINLWIDLKKKDGTIDTLYRYWVLGRNDTLKTKRWSIVRDVLHWVD